MTDTPQWVLPAQIPFSDLKSKDLEECVFWLLDAMGARDLEWRTGGSGDGAADGGRDLEATFYVPSPDGEMDPQRWWVECKGRKGTVEASAVKEAVNNAMAQGDLAFLVIATNTTFSNPTRDWVAKRQLTNPRPKIRLWDHEMLERHLSKHPAVVLRLFSNALSPAGLLKAAQERFWIKLEYTPVPALRSFWKMREKMEISPLARLSLIANEFAHGNITERPWAAAMTPEQLLEATQLAFSNLGYLRVRIRAVGADLEPTVTMFAHLVLACLQHVSASRLAKFVVDAILSGRDEVPDDVLTFLIVPVLNQLQAEIQEVCSSDCRRISFNGSVLQRGPQDPIKTYWQRFEAGRPGEKDPPEYNLLVERHDESCKVGFDLDKDHPCPLFEMSPSTANTAEFLAIVQHVALSRIELEKKAAAKANEDADIEDEVVARARKDDGASKND